jgi:hypothetical protein
MRERPMGEEPSLESQDPVHGEREQGDRRRDHDHDLRRTPGGDQVHDRGRGRDREQGRDRDPARETEPGNPLRGTSVNRVIPRRLLGIKTYMVDNGQGKHRFAPVANGVLLTSKSRTS